MVEAEASLTTRIHLRDSLRTETRWAQGLLGSHSSCLGQLLAESRDPWSSLLAFPPSPGGALCVCMCGVCYVACGVWCVCVCACVMDELGSEVPGLRCSLSGCGLLSEVHGEPP